MVNEQLGKSLDLNKGTNKKNAPLWQIFRKLTAT